jgi:hypothetical protein
MEDFIAFYGKNIDYHCGVVLLFKIRFNSRSCSSLVSVSISDKISGYVLINL